MWCRRRELDQEVQQLAGGVTVLKETLYGPGHSSTRTSSPSPSRSVSPARGANDTGALLASHGQCCCLELSGIVLGLQVLL